MEASASVSTVRERCRNSLVNFVEEAWPILEPRMPFVRGNLVEAICEHLEAVSAGLITRLLINVPPGSAKSLLVSVMWPAWEWGPRGLTSYRYISTSFAESACIRDVRKMRLLVTSDWYQRHWPHVELTRGGELSFENTLTGTRDGVAFSSLTSRRGDRLICLPFDQLIQTRNGLIEIGKIVSERLDVEIAGWDGRKVVWQRIAAWERNPPGAIIEITVEAAGHQSVLRCTGDHQVFTAERGWVRADEVKDGETALVLAGDDAVHDVRSGNRECGEQSAPVLQQGLLSRGAGEAGGRGENDPLQGLRETVLSAALQSTRRVLFARVFRRWQCRGEQPGVSRWVGDADVRALRRLFHAEDRRGETRQCGDVLGFVRGQITLGSHWAARSGAALRALWRGISHRQQAVAVLLDAMQKRGSRRADSGRWQRAIRSWFGAKTVSAWVDANFQGGDQGAGWQPMPGLRLAAASGGTGASYSSYRLREGKPRSDESDQRVQVLPRDDARRAGVAPRVVRATVIAHRRIAATGEPTFNLRVTPCHNYFAGGILVHNCDDPHSVEKAESQTDREKATRRFRESAVNRLNDQAKSAIVVVMQRLHEADISGVIQEFMPDYVQVILPMEYESGRHCETAIGFSDWRRSEGELLFPARWGRPEVENLKRDMDKWAYASQYQQRPAPRGGGIFPYTGWELWSRSVAVTYGRNESQYPDFDMILGSLDSAYGMKQENDYSAFIVMGVWTNHHGVQQAMLMACWQKRLPLNELVDEIIKSCRKLKCDRLLIELKGSGISVAQEVSRLTRDEEFAVQRIDPGTMDKVSRAHALSHLWGEEQADGSVRKGVVWVPAQTQAHGAVWPRDWAELCMSQMASFPKGKHDDIPDAVCQALKFFRDRGLLKKSTEVQMEEYAELMQSPLPPLPLYPI
jgi:phage terminase large subunit-like protein